MGLVVLLYFLRLFVIYIGIGFRDDDVEYGVNMLMLIAGT